MKPSSTHNSGNDFSNPLEEKYQNLTFDFGVSDKNDNKATLKAPNGKASNLSAEQHRLVRTPAFKAWFGDWENDPENASKVVDENGEPLVVYHGTNIHFNIFDLNKTYRGGLGTGFYFTENKEKADAYGSFLKEVFLNVKNPILVTGSNSESDLRDILNLSSTATEKEIREKSIILNHDGVVKSSKRNKFSEICVFTPTQIKLADGSNTTFDQSNPDIRFAEGGQTETLIAPNEKSNPVKEFFTWYKNWYKPISGEINIMFSVPNELHLEEFLAMITEENVVVMDLFEKIDQNIDAKPFMRQICEKADELGIIIYLEPNPRYKYFAENTEKRNKINKQYLFDYYSNFGFEPTSDKRFMKRIPNMRFDKGGEVDYKKLELERIAAKYQNFDFDLSGNAQKKIRLAPNGKPSKLNEVQYKAVRSANFINWFGDWQKAYKTGDYTNVSKCIDENGEPLIVYRGHSKKESDQYTKVFNYQVNRFSQNRNPNRFAFYFTESYYVANQYGGGDDEGIVTPYFLNIREMCDFTPSNQEYPNETEFYLPYADKYDKIWIESLVKIKEGKVTFANYKDELPEAVVSFFEKMQGRVTERNFEGFKNLIEKKANYKMQEIVDENEKYYGSNATLKQVIKMIDPNMPLSIMDTNDTHYTNFFQDYFNKNFPVFFFFIHHISFLYWNLPENTDIILKNEMVKRGFTGGKFLERTYAHLSPTGTEMVYFNFYPEDVKLADGSNYTFRPDVKDTDYGNGGMITIYPD